MFRSFHKAKGAVTLFHAPKSAVSNALATFIRTKFPRATQDQFSVDITESAPTPEQWRIIAHSSSLRGPAPAAAEARTILEEAAKLGGFDAVKNEPVPSPSHAASTSASGDATPESTNVKVNKYPILVDWDTGKVAIDNEALSKEILNAKLD